MRLPNFDLGAPTSFASLTAALTRIFRPLVTQLNSLSDGKISASNTASTAPPDSGMTPYAAGDYIRNIAPAVADGKVLLGWVCVTAGAPGTWVPCYSTTS